MDEFAQPPAVTAQSPKTSGLAIAAFIMGTTSMVVCVIWPVLFIPAIVCGIMALVKISRSNGTLKGQWMAIVGIAIPAVMTIIMPILMAILLPALSRTKQVAQRVVCGTNLRGLGIALIVYSQDADGKLPVADNWCDALMNEADVLPKSFLCPGDNAVEGQSSYALNRNAAEKHFRNLPPDMVLLFETSAGQTTGPRWNQVGGPESLTAENHQGCNILFADGSVSFIPADQLHTLRWTPD